MKPFVAGFGIGGPGYAAVTPSLVSFQTTQFLGSFITFLNRPASVRLGDLIVIAFATQNGIQGLQAIPGFTLLASFGSGGSDQHWRIQSRVIDGTEPLIWTCESIGPDVDIEAVLLHFRDVDDFQVGTFSTDTDDNSVGNTITPAGRGTLYFLWLGLLPGAEVLPVPSGMTLLADNGLAARSIVWQEPRDSAAPTGDRMTASDNPVKRMCGLVYANGLTTP